MEKGTGSFKKKKKKNVQSLHITTKSKASTHHLFHQFDAISELILLVYSDTSISQRSTANHVHPIIRITRISVPSIDNFDGFDAGGLAAAEGWKLSTSSNPTDGCLRGILFFLFIRGFNKVQKL
eukprot:TRINITY_DN956_c0_g1_i9.p1 TRINITY_DN956_c0_g1~~TRINITY_DN956_c0_g1_i9.p1  ORF type:complete len:124 (-),score=8.92 TRINITY_DN956_c0_g1_i9:9-380(-)